MSVHAWYRCADRDGDKHGMVDSIAYETEALSKESKVSMPVTDRRRIKFVCSTPVAFVLAQMSETGAIMLKSARESTENVGANRFVSASGFELLKGPLSFNDACPMVKG